MASTGVKYLKKQISRLVKIIVGVKETVLRVPANR